MQGSASLFAEEIRRIASDLEAIILTTPYAEATDADLAAMQQCTYKIKQAALLVDCRAIARLAQLIENALAAVIGNVDLLDHEFPVLLLHCGDLLWAIAKRWDRTGGHAEDLSLYIEDYLLISELERYASGNNRTIEHQG